MTNTSSLTEPVNTRSLIGKGLSYAFGDGSSTLVNLVVFTILLRYLSPGEFGYLSIGQALSSWVQPILYMGASLVAVRLIAENPQQTFVIARRMIGLRFGAATLVISCTIASALQTSDGSLRLVLLAYSLLFLFYPVQPDFFAIGFRRPQVYLVSRCIGAACFLFGIMMLTRISIRAWMVPLAYAGSLLSSAAYGYFALWPALRSSDAKMESGVGLLLRAAIGVVAAQFLQMGQSSINTILMKLWKVPIALIGDYSATGRLTQAGVLPFIALIYSLAPVYVKQFASRDVVKIKELERRFRVCLLIVGIAGAAIIITIGPQILEVISNRKMAAVHQLAPIFAIGYLLVALHNSYTAVLVYAGATRFYVAVYALGFIGTVLTGIVLIPIFGSIGSAWSEVTGLAIILISSSFFHRQLIRQTGQEPAPSPVVTAAL